MDRRYEDSSSNCLTSLTVSCTTDSVTPQIEQFKTFEKTNTLTIDDLKGIPPQDAVIFGDTLYVLTRDSLHETTVELFLISSEEHLGSLKHWQTSDGMTDSLVQGMSISVFDSLLCIASEKSRVDIFDRRTLQYRSTIGNGNWWGDENTLIVHSFALELVNNLLIIRDKHNLRMYSVEELTEENHKKVPLTAKSVALGGNSSKKRFGMTIHDEYLYVTDYPNRSIERFSLSSIQAGDMEIKPVDTIPLPNRPFDISSHGSKLFIPTDANSILVYDPLQNEFIQRSSLEGYTLESPRTMLFHEDDFAIVETVSKSVVLGKVKYHELSIYN